MIDSYLPKQSSEQTQAPQMKRLSGLAKSFRFAFTGLARAVASQRNMKIHLLCALLVALFGMAIPLDLATRSALVFAIALVFFAEILNTSLEALVDLAAPDFHPMAMVAKDAAAAGVLILAAACAMVFGDIVWMRLDLILHNADRVAYFSLFGAPLVLIQSLGLFVVRSRPWVPVWLIASWACMLPLVDRSIDPLFALMAFALICVSAAAMWMFPVMSSFEKIARE